MNTDERLKLSLEDVLADLWHARRSGDIGRLALLSYCDVRRWARVAHHQGLAARSHELVLGCPHSDREDFLFAIDQLIAEVEQAHAELAVAIRFSSPRVGLDPRDQCSNIPTVSGSNSAFELRFRNLFKPGRAFAFPCDAEGNVDLGGMRRTMPKQLLLRPQCCWFGSGLPPDPSLGSERLTPARIAG
jgi:hypothetical protein